MDEEDRRMNTPNSLPFVASSLRRFVALLLLLATPAFAQVVSVTKAPLKPERKTFDPDNLPDPKPPLKHHEVAACEYSFKMEGSIAPIPNAPKAGAGGGFAATIRVHRVQVKLSMPMTIWLPKNVDDHVKAHEEGHKQIAETFYKDADKTARQLANQMIGKAYEGKGATQQEALGDAVRVAYEELWVKYEAAVNTPCDRVQEIYDQITENSRNKDIPSPKAVQMALEQWKQEEKEKKK
jgi:hypothetical protein